MVSMPVNEIISKLVANTSHTEDEIRQKISQKMESLSGLISEEGAGHIVANELGVQLFKVSVGAIKLNDIKEGMKNVDLVAKIIAKFDVREFNTGTRTGKVGNFLVQDETGTMRITLWGDLANKLNEMREGDVVKVKSGYVRLNNRGFKEVHLNDRSTIAVNPPGVEVKGREVSSRKIGELTPEDTFVELRCHVVNVFDPNFFEQCPTCRKRPQHQEGKYICLEHGEIIPKYSYVVNLLLDDGSGTMRAACWANIADTLFGNLEVIQSAPEMFDSMKNEVLGAIVRIKGNIKKNEM